MLFTSNNSIKLPWDGTTQKKRGKSKASNTKCLYYFFFYIISESYNKLIIFLYMCFVIKTKEIILFAVMTDELDIFKHP